jgi:acetolactate synthase small subunit
MTAFHIHYRNTQGTLMRILTAASRRGLELPYLEAKPSGHHYRVDLLIEVNAKQFGQLCRDWYAIVDVTDVRTASPSQEMLEIMAGITAPHPPLAAPNDTNRANAALA